MGLVCCVCGSTASHLSLVESLKFCAEVNLESLESLGDCMMLFGGLVVFGQFVVWRLVGFGQFVVWRWVLFGIFVMWDIRRGSRHATWCLLNAY